MPEPEPMQPLPFYNPAAFAFDTEVVIALIADMQIRKAIERGAFDNLRGAGKPLDLADQYDPDWWLKSLAKREGLAMMPPSIQLRKDDAALDQRLDRCANEAEVRGEVERFNARVIWARYQLPAGPPLVTMPRDVEDAVAAWADRRAARAEQARQHAVDDARSREGAGRRARRVRRKRTRRSSRHDPEP